MSFGIDTLEIPQGATELTTSELKQISGGWCSEKHKEVFKKVCICKKVRKKVHKEIHKEVCKDDD